MAEVDPRAAQPESAVQAASDRAERLLSVITHQLRTAASQEPGADKLFPNGIELIHVKVQAGPSISAEIRIAGPKGAGSAEATADETVSVGEASAQ